MEILKIIDEVQVQPPFSFTSEEEKHAFERGRDTMKAAIKHAIQSFLAWREG